MPAGGLEGSGRGAIGVTHVEKGYAERTEKLVLLRTEVLATLDAMRVCVAELSVPEPQVKRAIIDLELWGADLRDILGEMKELQRKGRKE